MRLHTEGPHLVHKDGAACKPLESAQDDPVLRRLRCPLLQVGHMRQENGMPVVGCRKVETCKDSRLR